MLSVACSVKNTKSDGLDISGYETQAHKLLVPAANYVLGLEDGKKRFLDLVLAATKSYSLCSTLDEAKELREKSPFTQPLRPPSANLPA